MRADLKTDCSTCFCWRKDRGCYTLPREMDWKIYALGLGGRCPSWVPGGKAERMWFENADE